MPADATSSCDFETERLVAGPWHDVAAAVGCDLAEVVGEVLTPATTADLPPDWQGAFDRDRAGAWIADRDAEATMLLVVSQGEPVGFVALVVPGEPPGDVRIGYVLAERCWGRGLATELIDGLVGWARTEPSVIALTGGVAVDNHASRRVLTKAGFTVRATAQGVAEMRRDTSG